MNKILEHIKGDFQSKFSTVPVIARSPGRINLMGDHTDYNDGFTLPVAINRAAYIAAQRSGNDDCVIVAIDFGAKIVFDIHDELQHEPEVEWVNYVIGVVDHFKKKDYPMEGFHMIIESDVPITAGLSSSSAVTCGVAFALNHIFDFGLSKLELAKICHEVENGFVGSHCGLMDQLASCMSKKGHAMRLDCRTMEYTYFPVDLGKYAMVLFDTQKKRSTEVQTELIMRQDQCKIGMLTMKEFRPEITALRDATFSDLDNIKHKVNPTIYKRCKFVIEENMRVNKACNALLKNDLESLGKIMYSSHLGLRKLMEVTNRELNVLGRLARYEDFIIGNRTMGVGFGGCSLNLVRKDKIERIVRVFRQEYKILAMGEFEVYQVDSADGVSLIEF